MPQPLMNIRPGATKELHRVFISSSDEAAGVRRRISGLIDTVFNPSLVQGDWPFTLHADMWERSVAAKKKGSSTNEQFVERARMSTLTIVALLDAIRQGTQEELEAVLDEQGVEVSVLRFSSKKREDAKQDDVGKYLESIHDRIYYYGLCEDGADSDDAWFEVVRSLLALVLTALLARQEDRPYVERR